MNELASVGLGQGIRREGGVPSQGRGGVLATDAIDGGQDLVDEGGISRRR